MRREVDISCLKEESAIGFLKEIKLKPHFSVVANCVLTEKQHPAPILYCSHPMTYQHNKHTAKVGVKVWFDSNIGYGCLSLFRAPMSR